MNISKYIIDRCEDEEHVSFSNFSILPNKKIDKIVNRKTNVNYDIYDHPQEFISSVLTTKNLVHPNLAKIKEFIIPAKSNHTFQIHEKYLPNKTLYNFIKERSQFQIEKNATELTQIIYGILSAMTYLHSKNIAHQYLSPKNIYIDKDEYPILSNFWYSQFVKEYDNDYYKKQEVYYMAPEMLIGGNKFSKEVDIYSFGMTLLYIFTPNFKCSNKQVKSINQLINHIINGKRYLIPDNVPKFYVKLIRECLAGNPSERPAFDEIIREYERNDEFILEGADKEKVKNYIKLISSYVDQSKDEDEYNETEEFNFH